VGILAALHHRERTGEGQHIDLALLDTQVAVLANQALNYLVGGQPPPRLGNAHPNIVPYQTFPTRDGHIIIAIGTDRQFREFCAIAGLASLPDDPRFANNSARVANRNVLAAAIAAAMPARSTAEWIAALEAAAVPCGPINDIAQVFADPHVRNRGLALRQTRPDGTEVPGLGNPIRFSASPVDASRAAPRLGADTRSVLKSLLGLSDSDVDALKDDHAIGES
jgi:crotonobetainyl-CoA:carnitine CoA-transferase CaiB-like acyl-CoA transferase